MRITTLHINSLILAIMLVGLQCYMIWSIEQNGGVSELLKDDIETIALFFSPTAALAFTLRQFAGKTDDECVMCAHRHHQKDRVNLDA